MKTGWPTPAHPLAEPTLSKRTPSPTMLTGVLCPVHLHLALFSCPIPDQTPPDILSNCSNTRNVHSSHTSSCFPGVYWGRGRGGGKHILPFSPALGHDTQRCLSPPGCPAEPSERWWLRHHHQEQSSEGVVLCYHRPPVNMQLHHFVALPADTIIFVCDRHLAKRKDYQIYMLH